MMVVGLIISIPILSLVFPKQIKGIYHALRYGNLYLEPPLLTGTAFQQIPAVTGVTGFSFDCVMDDGVIADTGDGVIESDRSLAEQVDQITIEHQLFATIHASVEDIPSCAVYVTALEYDRLITTRGRVLKAVNQ